MAKKKKKENFEFLEENGEYGTEIYENTPIEEVIEENKKQKKKKGKNYFGKKNKGDFVEEEDLYYGIQIKPFDELRKGYDIDVEDLKEEKDEDPYAKLFDDTITSLDDEIEENFRRIQQERRKRVALAVESAGVDVDKVADELGIIAPMPVTAKAKDNITPIDSLENTAEFAKAISETAKSNTMELKLNVINNALEISEKKLPVVDEETIDSINKTIRLVKAEENTVEEKEEVKEAESEIKEEETKEEVIPEFPTVRDNTKYREKTLPVHLLNIDVMQSALVSEASSYEVKANLQENSAKATPFARYANEEAVEITEDNDEEIDDYVSSEDAKPIFADLNATLKKLSFRAVISFVSMVVLLIASMACEGNKGEGSALAYLIISAVMLILVIAVNFKSLIVGLKNLLNFKANSDSAAAVAAAAVSAQVIAGFFNTKLVGDGTFGIYGYVLAFILLLNVLGKTVMVKRIHGNFRFITSREQKYAVRCFSDHNTALKLTKNTVSEAPKIAYQQKAGFLKRFLQFSYKSDPAELASERFAPIALIVCIVFAIIALLITKNMMAAINTLAATALISTPACNLICLNMPISRFCRKLNRAGAMAVGFEGIKAASSVNSVMVDASELFPLGTVTLEGVKTFGERDSENDIFLAGAVANKVGGITADIFHQVNDEADYGEADSVKVIEDCGIEGVIGGKKVLIGNHGILTSNNITPPEKDEVLKYTESNGKNVKKVLFVAVDGELSSMLILSYKADPRKRREIKALEKNGIALIINTSDSNVTKKLINKLFLINESYISIVSGDLSKVYENTVNTEVTRADAIVATKGRAESLMKAVTYSSEIKPVLSTLVVMQSISSVIGLLIALLFTLFSPLSQIGAFAIVIFDLFWLLVMLIIPRFKLKIK